MSTATLYSNVISFDLYDEVGRQVDLIALIEAVVVTAESMTMKDRIEFELIARGVNYDPTTKQFEFWTDSWLLEQLRNRLSKKDFYTWCKKPEGCDHPRLRLFTIKRNDQVEDLSYLIRR